MAKGDKAHTEDYLKQPLFWLQPLLQSHVSSKGKICICTSTRTWKKKESEQSQQILSNQIKSCVASKFSLMFVQHPQQPSFKVLQIRMLSKALFALLCIERALKLWCSIPSFFFSSNNIAQCTGDSAEQLRAADIGDNVVVHTVNLHITWGKYEQLHYSALSANTLYYHP